MDLYAKAVQNGLKTRNECRQLENDPPVTGGDQLTTQTNLAPLDMLGKIQEAAMLLKKTLSLSDCQIKLDGDGGKVRRLRQRLRQDRQLRRLHLRGAFESTLRNSSKPKMFTATSGISPSESGSRQRGRARTCWKAIDAGSEQGCRRTPHSARHARRPTSASADI